MEGSEKTPWYKRTWVLLLVTFTVGIGLGGAGSSSEDDDGRTVTETVAAAAAPDEPTETSEPEPAPEPQPEPEPTAKASLSYEETCDYLLTFKNDEAGRFVASLTVTNEGEAPGRVKATASFKQLGGSPVTQTKSFSVPAGGEREIQFSISATSEEIDAHQSAGDPSCDVRHQQQ